MNVRQFACAVAFCSVGISSVVAQNLTTYLPAGAGSVYNEFPANSPATPSGALLGPYAGPARPLAAPEVGAIAVDNERQVVYSTNGTNTIERRVYPRMRCGVAVTMPSLPIPAAVGIVTGMAFDPATQTMFLTNGVTLFHIDPTAGMAVLCAWPAAPLNFLVGLDFDSATPGTVMGVSSAGEIASYAICGGIVGMAAPTYPWPGARAVGMCVDKSTAATRDPYVIYANGEIYNHAAGALVHTGAQGVGLSYAASPVHLPSTGSCGGVAPRMWTNALATQGKASFGFSACNLPMGTPTAFLVLNGGFGPPIAGPWGTFWLAGAGAVIPVPVAGGATEASFALPLPGGTAGLGFYAQWAVPCPAGGLAFTNALQVEISR